MNQVGIDYPYPLTNTTFKPMFNSLESLVSRRFGHFLNRKKFARAFSRFFLIILDRENGDLAYG